MVARKSKIEKPKEKVTFPSKNRRAPTVKLDLLEDAYIDGKWTAEVGTEILVERIVHGKAQRSLCIVKELQEDHVQTWDDTREYWFSFKLSELEPNNVVVKIFKRPT